MTTLPSHTASEPTPSSAPALTLQYNHSPSVQDASVGLPHLRFPSTLPESLPSVSPSSSSNPSLGSCGTRKSPTTSPPNHSTRFRLPRFSLFGRSTPDSLLCDRISSLALPPTTSDATTDLERLHIGQRRALSLVTSHSNTYDQRLDPEAEPPAHPPPSSDSNAHVHASMPMLVINEPVGSSPVSSPKLGSVWRLSGGLFASSAATPQRGRPVTADSAIPREVNTPASQFAAWSELVHGAPPPDRSTTFSSISSASCSSSSRPSMKKVGSHDSIRSSGSARPVDSELTASVSHSTIPVPKVIKTKLRSKSKSGQEVDLDNVFLAQELHCPSSSACKAKLSRSQHEAMTTNLSAEKRTKRSSWAARRSTSPQAVQTGGVRSSIDQPDPEWHAQRGRIDRQLSTCSYLTTASSTTTGSSDVGEATAPRSPRSTGEPEPTADCRAKLRKTTKRKTYALQFSLDGRYVAAAGSDHLIRVYEVLSSPSDRADEIELASMQRSESKTCSAGACPRARSTTPELAPIFKSSPIHIFTGHTGDVLDLCWSKNNFLLSCSSDKTARLWHPNRSYCLCTFSTSAVVSCLDFHPEDDRFFVTGGLDGKVRLWNIAGRRVQSVCDVPGVITAIAFTRGGGKVCVGTHAGGVLTFGCSDRLVLAGSLAVNKKGAQAKVTSVKPIQLPQDEVEEYMAVTSNDSRIRIYAVGSRSFVSRFKSTSYVNRTSQIRATPSSDSTFIVSGGEDASIHIWSVRSSLPAPGLFGGIKRSKSILRNDDGDASTWRSWHAGSGSIRCAVFAPQETTALLALAHDPIAKQRGRARIIVSTDDSNSVRVWRSDPSSCLF